MDHTDLTVLKFMENSSLLLPTMLHYSGVCKAVWSP